MPSNEKTKHQPSRIAVMSSEGRHLVVFEGYTHVEMPTEIEASRWLSENVDGWPTVYLPDGPGLGFGEGSKSVCSTFHRIDLFTCVVYAKRKRVTRDRSQFKMIAFRHGFKSRQEALNWGHEWSVNRYQFSIKSSLEVK